MRFFEDYQIDKQSKIGITHLLSNITTREGSHKGGWTRLLKCQLTNLGFTNVTILDNKNSLQEFDHIIFDLGAEFSGALNMFGGLDEKVFKRLTELKNFTGSLSSWRNELPSILTLSGRRSNVSSCEAFKQTAETFLPEVQEVLSKVLVFDHAYRTDKMLIGDSHTPSVWTPEYMIERRDGRTVKGMLEKNTIAKYVKLFADSGVKLKGIQVHCGSIDIRHHVCRLPDPEQECAGFIMGLVTQLHDFDFDTVVLTHTMGIEDESRELPKTGYFKGTPYYGAWGNRNLCRLIFNEVIDDYTKDCPGWSRVSLPEYFFNPEGRLDFSVMEKPQSVHLSPEHYRWNLDNNSNRWIHEEGR
jgi:hypothetical protein